MKKLIATTILSFLFFANPILAQTGNTKIGSTGIGTAFENAKEVAEQGSFDNDATFDSMAGDIIQLALSVLGVLFVVFMIYAGYLWLTAAGNEQKVAKAKRIIFQSIIGLVLVIAAYTITYFIVSTFENQVNLN